MRPVHVNEYGIGVNIGSTSTAAGHAQTTSPLAFTTRCSPL
jgi:hypothetical protein